MIALLTGRLDSIGEDRAVVDVGGVGYLVFCSAPTLDRLAPVGETVRLQIETHVREDHIHLYGFADVAEREWFRLLTTVQGVGARVALAILSVLTANDLLQAIAAGDNAAVSRANGVGAKLAARIVSELKDKVGALPALAGGVTIGHTSSTSTSVPVNEDAVSALTNLGYGRTEAFGAIAKVSGRLGEDLHLDELIRAGLQEISQ
jgi:holliday junction DNA helicase RuvA